MRGGWVSLREKNGKRNEMPCHQKEQFSFTASNSRLELDRHGQSPLSLPAPSGSLI
jgi:hypothetical protein